jgi:hypothetical protein
MVLDRREKEESTAKAQRGKVYAKEIILFHGFLRVALALFASLRWG